LRAARSDLESLVVMDETVRRSWAEPLEDDASIMVLAVA
jgi:hypothetical protein